MHYMKQSVTIKALVAMTLVGLMCETAKAELPEVTITPQTNTIHMVSFVALLNTNSVDKQVDVVVAVTATNTVKVAGMYIHLWDSNGFTASGLAAPVENAYLPRFARWKVIGASNYYMLKVNSKLVEKSRVSFVVNDVVCTLFLRDWVIAGAE
jgi:hypothetical protein